MTSRAQQLLENTDWGDMAGRIGVRAGITAGLLTGIHYAGKNRQRKHLRQFGYINHPHDTNVMLHPETGKMFHLGRGMPIN